MKLSLSEPEDLRINEEQPALCYNYDCSILAVCVVLESLNAPRGDEPSSYRTSSGSFVTLMLLWARNGLQALLTILSQYARVNGSACDKNADTKSESPTTEVISSSVLLIECSNLPFDLLELRLFK